MSYSGFRGLAMQGYTGLYWPIQCFTWLYWAMQCSGLYWAIQGFTWLHWAMHIHKAILGCTGLWMLRYTELFCGIKGYIGLHWAIKGNTASATAAIAINAKVWHSEWVSQWVSESVTVLDLERLAPLKMHCKRTVPTVLLACVWFLSNQSNKHVDPLVSLVLYLKFPVGK